MIDRISALDNTRLEFVMIGATMFTEKVVQKAVAVLDKDDSSLEWTRVDLVTHQRFDSPGPI